MNAGPIFDDRKLASARLRAQSIAERLGADHHGFLHQDAAAILGERLAATKRNFDSPAILFEGPFSTLIVRTMLEHNPPVTGSFQSLPTINGAKPVLPVDPGSLDLVVTIFDTHRVNDLPSLMMQINHALRSDGLFLGVFPAAGTLHELSNALMEAELATTGGAATRVDLFAEIRQFGDLLQKTGFKLPVCDVEERVVRFRDLQGLLNDLRGAGVSSAVQGDHPPLSRPTLRLLEKTYKKRFSDPDGRLRATVNMAFLSGWKEDDSQQKPLRPGAAKHNLKDFL